MPYRRTWTCLFLVAAAGLCQALAGPATVSLLQDAPSLNELELEVDALYVLYQLQVTPEQMKALKKLASETADDLGARQVPKASAEYRKTVIALRDALVKADDPDKVAELQEKLDELGAAEEPELDLAVEITAAARKHAPAVLKMLTARQVAGYVSIFGDGFPDPRELMVDALDKVRGVEQDAWKDFRAGLSEEVGRLVAGVDADKVAKISDKVVQWLIEVRSLGDDEFKTQRADLEKRARQITGELHPFDVLRNSVELALAELLSNPRLEAAVEARLKAGK
jgi:hypothetical protein